MNRRTWMSRISGLIAVSSGAIGSANAASAFPLAKSKPEWKKLLPEQKGSINCQQPPSRQYQHQY